MVVDVDITRQVNLFKHRVEYYKLDNENLLTLSRHWEIDENRQALFSLFYERRNKMIQSVQELPLILPTNTSDITFLNDELKTRSATCSGWLNHTEGTSQYTMR